MGVRVKNIAAGFYDTTGFHPIRSSADYDPDRAGDEYSQRTAKPKRKKRAAGRKAKPKAKAHRKRTAARVGRKRNPYAVTVNGVVRKKYARRDQAVRYAQVLRKRTAAAFGTVKVQYVPSEFDERRQRNPIPIKWATAKVRKVGNDIQVMLFPRKRVARRRATVRKRRRR